MYLNMYVVTSFIELFIVKGGLNGNSYNYLINNFNYIVAN